MQQSWGRVKLTEVNPHLVCVLCHGYFIDATTMAECPHSFCRSCIVLYLETKSYCPICEVQIHKTKPHLNLKPDKTLQDIVYKLVPGLFHDEMRRRREFYAKYPNRDLYLSPEARGVGVERIIYSPEDSISLSLEYYDDDREREEWAATRPGFPVDASTQQQQNPPTSDGLKRYLQCPAVVTMSHLKKFIRLKYGLSQACTVEILYRRESLPDSYSLMDIAYIYTWKRNGPMRFYYRIHVPTPLKTVLPPLKASTEPIRDTAPEVKNQLPSPELLDAVGLRPKPPGEPTITENSANLNNEISIKPEKKPVAEEAVRKDEERKRTTPAEDTAVSLLLALSNGHGPKPEQSTPESKLQSGTEERQPTSAASPRPPTSNGGVFKVPQSMTKRFVINGGKLVAVKSKQAGGKAGKAGEKAKLNGKLMNGESPLMADRFTNPLGLVGNGPLGFQDGKLPPGSPRPPPNSEKILKTKYMPPAGLLLNRLTPEVTVSQNKPSPELFQRNTQGTTNQHKPQAKTNDTNKSSTAITNGQPAHRKEVNRLEQIVQNCLKKETSLKSAVEAKSDKEAEVRNDAASVKRSGPLNAGPSEIDARAARGDASIRPADHVAANPTKTDRVDTSDHKGSEPSILKRKLNDPPYNRRQGPLPLGTSNEETHNGVGDPKKRRLVTPDVSIELMANPIKDKPKERKREPSDLSALTKRFLHDIQRMKKLDSELKINKLDQMCASTVKIEKVPAPSTAISKLSPVGGEKSKNIDGTDFSSEDDQLFIDIRNKCEALKRKNPEPVSIAIERVSEDPTIKPYTSQGSPSSKPTSSVDSPSKTSEIPTTSSSETSPKHSGTHKKLPRLIEINAPPRPKLPSLTPDQKQKTGLKMTTVRKEVPIGKEVPLVRRDSNGALDLSSGMSPPNSKNGSKSPFHRPSSSEKSPTPSSLSPLMAMTAFPMPDTNRSSPIRIPTLKPKSSPTPRPSSLSSSSPSPPAESRTPTDFPSAYQQLYRHQMELQSRLLASQVNNNWSRDPLSAKKFEEWMRNVMNLPHHPLMFPSQVSPEAGRK